MMEIRFLAPLMLWLLALVPLVWWLPRRLRNVRHGLLRSLLLATLVVALARPIVLTSDGVEHHVFVVDRSASVAPADALLIEDGLARAMERLPDSARVTRIDLGGAGAEVPAGTASVDDLQLADMDGSDLPRALVAAARLGCPRQRANQ